MEYAELVEVYRRLESTDSTLEKRNVLAEAFRAADEEHLPLLVTLCRGKIFAAQESADLGVSSSLATAAVVKATGVSSETIEADWRDAGDLGDAAASAVENRRQRTLFSTELDVRTVYDTLRELASYEGEGSRDRRVDAVAKLLSGADPEEARYVIRTVLGHLRVGVGEGTVRDAVALAFLAGEASDDGVDPGAAEGERWEAAVAAVERAHQLTNDFRLVAETARDGGIEGLNALDAEPFRPIKSMLAEKAESLADGLASVADEGEGVLLEYKYDGIRVQLHKRGEDVRVFTRRLEDVTEAFPDVVEATRERVTAEECILEGELVGYDPEKRHPVPFQRLSRRVARKHDVEEAAAETPVVAYLFDCVLLDGESLLEAPLRDRLDRLDEVLDPEPQVIERAAELRDPDEAAARRFYEEALSAGHEGAMMKNLEAAYQPGRRVGRMMKVKPVMEPLDLVVVRAKWSEGRRSEFLGRLYLACYDPEADEFREAGRLATGYTDEELEALTERLEPLVRAVEGREVRLRPEVVLEVEYEEIQESPTYESGFALRFPRFVRVREELAPEDADTVERVRELYESQ